jgi:amidohydrolase
MIDIVSAPGHNLIAVSGVGAFLGAVAALKQSKEAGRVRLLGTPAEEGGGGKCRLLDAGAFKGDVAASIMAHPICAQQLSLDPNEYAGLAGWKLVSSYKFKSEFCGKSAHAAGEPWNGRNALDAAVSAYTAAGLMRQQIRPEERIQAVIEVGGTVPNIIPEYTRMSWNLRSANLQSAEALAQRVKACISAAATATGCISNIIP